MGRQIKNALVLFAALFLMIGLTAQTMAYVPDYLASSAQPATIDADGESTTDITVQLMANLDGDMQDVVKMCGIEVTCESQDPDVLHNGNGGALLTGWTDEFGKVTFTYQSTGSEGYNEGDVDVICRSIQLEETIASVHVETGVATHFHVTMCPKSGYDDLSQGTKNTLGLDAHEIEVAQADIVADGSSHVYITAQLKNDYENPVHKVGWVRFKSMNTVIVKTCGAAGQTGTNAFGYNYEIVDTGVVLVETDEFGVATAEFCSAGTGSENVGSANIHIESVTFPNVYMNTTTVKTTNQFGTTYKDGFLAMSSMADQIMADEESCVTICSQTRDQDYRIIKKLGWQILLESENTSQLVANPWASETDHGLAFATTDSEGIALHEYCSSGRFDASNTGMAHVRGDSPTSVEVAWTYVDLRTQQIWPRSLEVIATMPLVDCDGDSMVTVTAQLLDKYGLATPLENRLITFESSDISGLKSPADGGTVIDAYTDAYGKAHATFVTTDCKFGGENLPVNVTASTQSISVDQYDTVNVVKPRGFVPDGVSVYTDQHIVGHTDDDPTHAKPYVISADGMETTYVTAQVCEWELEMCAGMVDCNVVNNANYSSYGDKEVICRAAGCTWSNNVCSGVSHVECSDFDGEEDVCGAVGCTYGYCNPVKRCGVEIDFEVLDDSVVQNKGTDNPNPTGENGISEVKLYTDDEGKVTAVFRSTGDAPSNKEKCTLIKVDGKNGGLLGTAYSEVCTRGEEGTYPNTIWIWADPAYITADGTSHTVVRGALYDCYVGDLPEAKSLNQQNAYDYLYTHCKPVHMPGVTVKFETLNTDALDDGMGGYKIYDTTNEFGQAQATFQSKGFDKQHMGPAEIEAWTVGSGEDVIQLNTLIINLEEKTWPWCPTYSTWFEEGSPEATADVDHDQYITDNELIEYIMNVWMNSYDPINNPYGQDDTALIQVIVAWLTQL